MDGPFCMTSPNYPEEYNNNQGCTIEIGSNGTITAPDFSTEEGFDTLSMNTVAMWDLLVCLCTKAMLCVGRVIPIKTAKAGECAGPTVLLRHSHKA
jgi:hypothetical protein